MIRPNLLWPSLTTAPLWLAWLAAAAPLARTAASQDEHGNREQSGETHAIDLLHGFLSETLTLWPLETPEGGGYSRERVDRSGIGTAARCL